jgi:hypothetical protein
MTARTASSDRPAEGGSEVLATVVLVLLTLVSTLGYLRVFSSHHWVPPVLATALGTHAVMWATRRLRLGVAVSAVVGLVAGALLVGWTVLGAQTWYGIPDGSTWSHLTGALGSLGDELRSAIAPVAVTTAFSLLVTIGAAVVALLGDLLAFRSRSALLGATPGFAGFVVACTLGTGPGRQMVVTAEVAALVGFLLIHRAAAVDAIPAWFANRREGAASSLIAAGSLSAVAALLVAVVVTPALGPGEGEGAFGWRTGIGDNGPGPREVANPVVDLRTRLL